MGTKRDSLSIEQQNAIDLLVQGRADQEVADAVGVTRQTVCEWRNHDDAFEAALNKRRAEVWGSGVDRLRALVAKAIDALAAELDSSDAGLRHKAAVQVLRAVGLYGLGEPAGPTSADGVRTQRELDGLARLF